MSFDHPEQLDEIPPTASPFPSSSFVPTPSPADVTEMPVTSFEGDLTALPSPDLPDRYNPLSRFPTEAPYVDDADNDAGQRFGWVTMSFFILIVGCVAWRCVVRCRKRQEDYMQSMRSAQVDRVLGDMEMVPQEDNELI